MLCYLFAVQFVLTFCRNHSSPIVVSHIGKVMLYFSNGVMEMVCFSYNYINTSVST